jgi:trimeric autotransporter adhesin
VGVLAQDLREVAPYMVHSTSLTDAAGKAGDYLAVDFGAMDFMLVNAVKELDADLQLTRAENEVLRGALADMRGEIDALKASLGKGGVSVGSASITVSPNPAAGETRVACVLPEGVRDAEVQVIGMDGKVYPAVRVAGGASGVTLDTAGIPAGTYVLKLVADGKVVATARLVAGR